MCGSPRRNDDGPRAVNSASSSPPRSIPTRACSLPIGLRSRPRDRLERRALVAPGLLLAAAAPMDASREHVVFMLHDAAHPDHSGDLVFRHADTLALEILRLANTGVGAHVHARAAKEP